MVTISFGLHYSYKRFELHLILLFEGVSAKTILHNICPQSTQWPPLDPSFYKTFECKNGMSLEILPFVAIFFSNPIPFWHPQMTQNQCDNEQKKYF